jgi:hypothetical protein
MTSSKTIDFCNANDIEWFPINLTINGAKKDLNPINHKLYNFIRPDLHDFSDKDLIRARQHLFASSPELFTHLCINTKTVFHIDIDTPEYSQGFDNMMFHCPYFKSMTKSYGRHIFIRAESDFVPESTRMQFSNDGKGEVELLCGQGSYAPLEMINADKPIMTFTSESLMELLEIKEKKSKPAVSQQLVASINTDKMLELGGIIKMDKINSYHDWLKILWALRSESEQYKEVAREISKRSKIPKDPYTKYDADGFEKAWDEYKDGSISIGTFYHYCKESNEKKYKAIIDKYTTKPEVKLADGRDYESVKVKFEKTHLLISNKGLFIRQTEDDNILMSKTHLITANERTSYDVVVNDDVKTKCFIHDWLKDDQNRMKYDMAVYPPDIQCPESVYNLWRPFTMETVSAYNKNDAAITMVKNHIKIMCGNNQVVSDYFELWIAQMIQFPSVKSICPTLISDEGAGKGTLMRLFERMLGRDKILQTTKPSQTVWGNFNGLMKNAFLVNFDELSKKEGEGAEGFIKGLITEPRITINNKGIDPYELASFHRFIITTNNEDPIKTSKRDRRKLIIRASDELIGNREYFNKIYSMLDDDNAVKSIYEYFKAMPGADKFKDVPMPETEYQKDIKESYTSPIELWLKAITEENIDEEFVEMTSSEQYDSFNGFKSESGINFECSNVSFSLKLKNLKVDGVGEPIHTKGGNKRKFEISKMKKHFNIGCLL